MAKYKQNGKKSERISLRCTKQDKERLKRRVKTMGVDEAEYLRKTLFPQISDEKNRGDYMEVLVELQDVAVHISEMYKEDSIQEELDYIWEKIKRLL